MRDLVHAAALKISDLGNPLKTFALVNELRGIDGKQARVRACQTPISEDRAELQNRARTLVVLRGTSLIAMVEATYLRFAPTGPISVGSGRGSPRVFAQG